MGSSSLYIKYVSTVATVRSFLERVLPVPYRYESEKFVYLAERADGYLKIGCSYYPSGRAQALSATGNTVSPTIDASQVGRDEYVRLKQVKLVRVVPGGLRHESLIHHLMREFLVAGCSEWYHDTANSRIAIGLYFSLMSEAKTRKEAWDSLRRLCGSREPLAGFTVSARPVQEFS